jgi:hypothetical protein
MIKDISNRLLRDFATCLQQRLAAEPSGAMTGEEAAASAGAAATAEQTPAEVAGEDVTAKAPGELGEATPPGTVATPPQAAPPASAAQAPAAAPIKGFSLVLGVLKDRIKRLFRRG